MSMHWSLRWQTWACIATIAACGLPAPWKLVACWYACCVVAGAFARFEKMLGFCWPGWSLLAVVPLQLLPAERLPLVMSRIERAGRHAQPERNADGDLPTFD